MILGTAGHIDHGKTTLVRALTGIDTDRLPEEKKRGITIELGFAPLTLDGIGTVGVGDVPGHEAFVRTMVAGATGIDLALVVIAADEGVMPQTREHLAILELLGVRSGVVALTKSDLVDADWLALVEDDARSAVSRALPDAPIIATSATTGAGLDELRRALSAALAALPRRGTDDLFRLPVDRVFTIKGTGTVATGTVWSGSIARDETVRILPGDRTARVRGMQGHGAQLDATAPGGRAAIALAGVDVADVPRGSTLVTDRDWHPTTLLRADVSFVPDVDVALRPRTWFRFHVGTSEVGARIVTRDVDASAPFAARIVLDAPVLLRAGDRFVLRTSAPLNTIAGGVVTDPYAPRRARLWPAHLSHAERLARFVDEAGGQGIDPASLPVRLGLSPAECRALVAADAHIVALGGRLVSATVVADLETAVQSLVDDFHAANALEIGAPSQPLKAKLHASASVADAVVERLVKRGELNAVGGSIARPNWSPSLGADDAKLADQLLGSLASAGSEPPSADELIAQFGDRADAILRFVERRGDVVQVEKGRYYTAVNLKSLVDRLGAIMAGRGEVSPAEIRDGLSLSRKYLIPFLEYCDRAGYTVRQENGRVWQSL